jgi:intracellular septation protein A
LNPVISSQAKKSSLSNVKVIKTWLPLVASWMLMSIELPAINAIVARLAYPEISLAAYGGVVYPIALIIEAPVIMLLAASTALSRDWDSYKRLRKITLWMGGSLMALHVLIAITPMFDFITNVLLQAPPEVVEPARQGLLFLSPWTFAIAFRRFQQGTMIRHGHSKMVGQTTFVRLITVALVLLIGFLLKTIPGTILAGSAQGLGVTAEAIYAGLAVRKLRPLIKAAPPVKEPLTLKRFSAFYLPLALTSSLWLLWQPLISAAVSRMPNPLESLAVWSVITGLLFMFRSPGVAYNEVMVALLEERDSKQALRRVARNIAIGTTLVILVFVLTPLSQLWLQHIAALLPDLVETGRIALILAIPLGVLSVYVSYYQGFLVHHSTTKGVAEAVVAFLIGMLVVLVIGVVVQSFKGVYIATLAFTLAHLIQAFWLWVRSRKQRQMMTISPE